jgi:hypothetical protein
VKTFVKISIKSKRYGDYYSWQKMKKLCLGAFEAYCYHFAVDILAHVSKNAILCAIETRHEKSKENDGKVKNRQI